MNKPLVIVTGASKGIGAASAERFAQAGYDIVINFNSDITNAEAVAAKCRAYNAKTLLSQGNIANADYCENLIQSALENFNRLDCLINNAARTKFCNPKDLSALTSEDFRNIYAVNVEGPYFMMRAAYKALAKQQGTIVNVSSTAAITGIGSCHAYTASKGALNSLSLSLAKTFAPDVRVNVVCPGYVPTTWWHKKFDALQLQHFNEKQQNKSILHRITSAHEVAETIYFVAHNKAMTGCCIKLDSGISLRS